MNKKRQETISNIIKNIVFIGVMCLSISIIFGIPIKNQYALLFFIPMLGINLYFLQQIQLFSEISSTNKDIVKLIETVIVLERTIKELQVLCTDEDVLKRCKNEVANELNMIKSELNLNE